MSADKFLFETTGLNTEAYIDVFEAGQTIVTTFDQELRELTTLKYHQ
jgi:arginine/ornithine N-succinyltransferase beta subunit